MNRLEMLSPMLVCLVLLLTGCNGMSGAVSQDAIRTADRLAGASLDYPAAQHVAQIDDYHGTTIADPYQWLEEQEAPDTQAWVRAQDALLREHLGDDPELARLEARFLAIQHFESRGVPIPAGDQWFELRTPAGEVTPEVWLRAPGIDTQRVLRITDHFAEGDQLRGLSASPAGRHFAFVVVPADSTWGSLHLFDVERRRLLRHRIDSVRGGVQWRPEGGGFYYIAYGTLDALRDGATPRAEIRFHALDGTGSDRLILRAEAEDPAVYSIRLTHDGTTLVITRSDGGQARDEILIYDPARPAAPPRPLIQRLDATFSFEGSHGDQLIFSTDLDSPFYRLIAIDRTQPDRDHWREIVPESAHAITAVSEIGDALVVRYSVDARPLVKVFGFDGQHRFDVELPNLGWLGGFPDDRLNDHAVYSLTTVADPGTVYRLDLETGASHVVDRPSLAFDPDDIVIRQVFYASADGTRIPMFLAHRRDVRPSPETPLFLYGYGHGGWSAWPWFQPRMVGWMELGGVYALAGLRGGGEYGAAWQAAGTAENKENTIADYVAAADWLVREGYTSYPRLVMNGGSASGVLAGVALTRRPEKIGAVMVDFPFLDMLRYHHFNVFPSWTRGYGSSDDPAMFEVLRGYSPYHQISPNTCYPPTLVQVGEVDETTPPLHGYKFIAALQAAQSCDAPILLKTAWGTKHNAGATRAQRAETWAQEIAFLARAVDLPLDVNL